MSEKDNKNKETTLEKDDKSKDSKENLISKDDEKFKQLVESAVVREEIDILKKLHKETTVENTKEKTIENDNKNLPDKKDDHDPEKDQSR